MLSFAGHLTTPPSTAQWTPPLVSLSMTTNAAAVPSAPWHKGAHLQRGVSQLSNVHSWPGTNVGIPLAVSGVPLIVQW